MTIPSCSPSAQNIVEVAKELKKLCESIPAGTNLLGSQKTHEAVFDVWHRFPAIASALLIAYKVLHNHEHLVRGECLEKCDMCMALKEIRSLTL